MIEIFNTLRDKFPFLSLIRKGDLEFVGIVQQDILGLAISWATETFVKDVHQPGGNQKPDHFINLAYPSVREFHLNVYRQVIRSTVRLT